MDPTEAYLYNQDEVGGVGETTSADNKEWCTGSEAGNGWTFQQVLDARKVWIVADLCAVYDLSTLKIWNFNWDNTPGIPLTSLNNRGVSQFDVYVRNSEADTDDGTAGGTAINLNNTAYAGYLNVCQSFNLGTSNQWQLALENQALARAPNADDYAGQSYDLTGKTGRFVALVADSHYGGGGAGLGKVRFDGTLAIPERATIGILLIGSLMGFYRRR
jgi:hypothetical protein